MDVGLDIESFVTIELHLGIVRSVFPSVEFSEAAEEVTLLLFSPGITMTSSSLKRSTSFLLSCWKAALSAGLVKRLAKSPFLSYRQP